MNLFIIGSPLQLVNASEAKHQLNIEEDDSHLLIINFFGERNLQQLKHTLEIYKWDNVEFFNYKPKNKISQLLKIRGIVRTVSAKFKNYLISQIFIGEYNAFEIRAIANQINAKTIILLDDGNGSIAIATQQLAKHKQKYSFSIRFLVYSLFGLNVREYKSIGFFTYYAYLFKGNNHKTLVIENELRLTKMLNQAKVQGNDIIFLGNKFVEKKYLSYRQYKDKLEFALHYLEKNISKNIVYLPHRGEALEKLGSLQKDLGLTIDHIDLPVELYLLKRKVKPKLVGTFFSSAVNSLNILFQGDVRQISFYISPSVFDKLPINVIEDIYQNYIDINIEVIKID